jgi:two-component system cell cycle response regulator CtrA
MTCPRCPTCGSALPEFGGIVADEERAEIRYNGKMVRNLTGTEFTLFRLLLDRKGRNASKEDILSGLYQLRTGKEEPEIQIVDVFICKLRKKIAPLGISIGTTWGRGYFLEEPK